MNLASDLQQYCFCFFFERSLYVIEYNNIVTLILFVVVQKKYRDLKKCHSPTLKLITFKDIFL